MFKKCLLALSLLLCASYAYADPQNRIELEVFPGNTVKLENSLTGVRRALKTPETEVADAILFLQDLPLEDRPFIRFFSTYAMPEDMRQDGVLCLSFILHNLIGPTKDPEGNAGAYYPLALREKDVFIPKRKVSDTLWWIDIRDYNWTEKSWELVSQLDAYFVEPIVPHDKYGYLRLLAGNAILRADWFIVHASDVTRQSDRGIDTNVYKTLLYSQVDIPKTLKELELNVFNIDLAKARQLGNEYGVVVTKSKAVAQHNRMLFGYRTQLGWYYRSYDVKFQEGLRDYVEAFPQYKGKPPTVFDGGEVFGSNQVFMQIYDLYNDKEELADFADPTLVRHMTDIIGDARVRTPHSCYDCHAAGPIPSENTLQEFIELNAKLKLPKKSDKYRVDRAFLSGKFAESIVDNQVIFARALKKINGLTPDENASIYMDIVYWYNQPITLEQAAWECGVSVDTYKSRMLDGKPVVGNGIVPGRIALMLNKGEPIPRSIWESPAVDGIPGLFQQSMIIINGLTTIEVTETKGVITVVDNVPIKVGSKTIETVEKGTILTTTGKVVQNDNGTSWIGVFINGTQGYVYSPQITQVK